MRLLLAVYFFFMLKSPGALAQVTQEESEKASRAIGQWLIKSTGHYDFQSATSVNPKRAGTKFFGIPNMQTASDYGYSYMEAPRDEEVTEAYRVIGADTSNMQRALRINRLHLNLGFANKHDFNFSYHIPGPDNIEGWGLAYKRVLVSAGVFFVSYRLAYSRASREDYFTSSSFMNDLSASVYLRLLDFYAGVRHWYGKVDFKSSIPELRLPTVHYFGKASEIESYFGVIAATTTNTRFTLEANSMGRKHAVGGKFSFHFDSLLPTMNNWFRDPRYIKQ